MASLFTRREALAANISDRRLDWATERGRYVRIAYGVYFKAERPPTLFEQQLAKAIRSGPVSGELAAALHGMDGFNAPEDGRYSNIAKIDPHETLLVIAATTTDLRWEQALEWCLRKEHTSIERLEEGLRGQRRGNGRIRRVLKLRPDSAPATGSILETYAVQLVRLDQRLPTPSRQVNVRHWYVDLAWPNEGLFLELDGEWHKDQPRYDAMRQTGVVAATRWLVGRYNWSDVVCQPNATLRSIADLLGFTKNQP